MDDNNNNKLINNNDIGNNTIDSNLFSNNNYNTGSFNSIYNNNNIYSINTIDSYDSLNSNNNKEQKQIERMGWKIATQNMRDINDEIKQEFENKGELGSGVEIMVNSTITSHVYKIDRHRARMLCLYLSFKGKFKVQLIANEFCINLKKSKYLKNPKLILGTCIVPTKSTKHKEDIKELNHWLENKVSEALSKDMVSIVLRDWNAVPNSRKDRFPSGKMLMPKNSLIATVSGMRYEDYHNLILEMVKNIQYKIEDTDISAKSDHFMVEIAIDVTQWIDNKQYRKNKYSKAKKKGLWRLKDATEEQWNKFESAVDNWKSLKNTIISAGNQELPKAKEPKNKVNLCNNGHKDFWLLSLLSRIHRIDRIITSFLEQEVELQIRWVENIRDMWKALKKIIKNDMLKSCSEKIKDISQNYNGTYYHLKGNEEKIWVPILPGFSIFINIKSNIYQLSIGVSEEKKILFSWINFGGNANNLKISISNLLGFHINGIVRILTSAVYQKYPHLYPNFQPIFKAQQVTEKTIKVVHNIYVLRKELDNNSETLIREGLLITTEKAKYVNYEDFMTNYIVKKKTENENNNSDHEESMMDYINKIIDETKLGSPILVSTKQFLFLVLQQSCNYCAKRLRKELDNNSETLIREGLLITTEKAKYVNYEDFMTNYIVKKKTENENNNSDHEESMMDYINKIIDETKLGSPILVSTKQFLFLVLQQSCNYCGETCFNYKKPKVSIIGFSVTISILYQSCEILNEFTNESMDINFNACVATSGLIGGVNRRLLQMVLACLGITSQICKATYFRYQKLNFGKVIEGAETSADIVLQKVIEHHKIQNKKIISVSFDCSWSHVRNAQQASGKIIYNRRDIEDKNGNERIIRKGNFDSSSRQMEHAILIALIGKLTSILEEHDILLNITIDRDLDSNKTLGNIGIVNQIFADLKHLTKNIRKNLKKYIKWQEFEQHIMTYFSACIYAAGFKKTNNENCNLQEKDIRYIQTKGLLQHLCGNHNICWLEICWIKKNPEIQLREPILKTYSNFERNEFKKMLESIFKLPFGQGIGTTIRTSQNEAFNRVKLIYTSKLIDYHFSYQTRHALAILHNNEGICELVNIVRQACNSPLSSQDLLNITKIEKERDQERVKNIGRIEKRNTERVLALQNLRDDLDSFDWNQELVTYGKKTQEQIDFSSFQLLFSIYIPDFNEITKCIGCHAFPKITARGLCRVCRFYIDNGLKNQIIDKNYKLKNEVSENIDLESKCKFALERIFQFSKFRNGQKTVIESFIQNQDTFVLKQTGGGKSLCYALASIIVTGIIVVFSPLKALVNDQVSELIKVGIPCCGLYASIAQSVHYQKKVFQEIASGLIRVIITTPEKFKFNIGFQKMLERIGNSKGIRFVIDEAHCILDQEHFRDSWNYLCNLKKNFPSAPILLLTATCRIIDAQEIVTRLGIDYQQISLVRDIYDILKIIDEIETGKCIVYCLTIKGCEDLLTNLQNKVSKEITIYHSELSVKEKSNTISLWKLGKVQIIIATNVFGMGINESGVRVVIHVGFPMSIGNLIQESGRAGRDRLPAKAIIFFNKKDIKTVMGIYTGGYEISISTNKEQITLDRLKYLSDAKKKIREVMFYCSTIYRYMEKILAVVDEITKTEQSQAKDIKERFGSLPIYQEKFVRKLKSKEDALLLLDDLILRRIVEEDIILNRSSTGQTYSCSIFIFGLAENALEKAKNESWNYLINKRFGSLPIYQEKFVRKLKSKEDALLLLDDLILRRIVEEDIILNRSSTGQTYSCSIFIFGLAENALEKAKNESWNYLINSKNITLEILRKIKI
ncbi:hypothetical protein Glove_88g115 [Diversispora epigaea]|uniref:DNA 3'-5' helicase n=1 Tax=Diversispora epigaea TaxID=1348612 RepID=A0A397J6M6_9GLOM|nr:hypothetical protein Glove_88g115 [Diversispora epigaea]